MVARTQSVMESAGLNQYFLAVRLAASLMIGLIVLMSGQVRALELTNRSIQVSPATPSAVATHSYSFVYASAGLLGSMVFEYCDNSPLSNQSCTTPAGLDVSAANLTSQSGNNGFSIDNADTTANKLVISRIPSAASAVTPASYDFSNITNPSASAHTVFVRIASFASTDGSGPSIDSGAVAFATTSPFNIGAAVPTFLRLCVAISVASDCSSLSGSQVNLGNLSSSQSRSGQSQFAAGTNSLNGYVTYILGTTMTSGNNSITALSSPTPSFAGNSQFGINLRDNSIPNVGQNPSGSGTASPTTNYDTPNLYMFHSGDAIAKSTQPSNYNRMTVSYIVNVNSAQPPGIYDSTFTYLATANF